MTRLSPGRWLQDFQVNQLLMARDLVTRLTPHHRPLPVTMAETQVATTAPGDPT